MISRDEARARAVDLLLGDNNPNASLNANIFENNMYADYENMPVSPVLFGNVSEANVVVITDEVFEELNKIKSITDRNNNEVAFLIFGEEKPNGTVWLDTIVSSPATARTYADFSSISGVVTKMVNDYRNGAYRGANKQIIVHGHTHGYSPVSDNFSLGDMISYIQFNDMYKEFKNREIETMSVLIPPCGDLNFMMYENNPAYEGFYKFPQVYLRHSDGRAEEIPSYKKGNYLVNTSGIRR